MSKVNPEWYHLRNALHEGDFGAAEMLLQGSPELLDERNGIGETVLHYLAVERCLPGIEWLYARGASLDTTNKFGTPLLFEVALLEYRHMVLWLIERGADANKKNAGGQGIEEYLTELGRVEMWEFIKPHIRP